MTTYNVKRMFFDDRYPSEIVATGLTLEEAREHCQDPETSSRTCTDPKLVALTEERGPWFDGYDEE